MRPSAQTSDQNDARLTIQQVAGMAGVHRDTILRWLREKRISEPARDRNGWRAFSREEALAIADFAHQLQGPSSSGVRESVQPNLFPSPVERLEKVAWDFVEAQTGYLTHGLHPYPAKFIPQIPNALIQELSSVGDTVLDPFCGSGTTLVEALLLRRHAVGVDANPLACLITRAKTARVNPEDVAQLEALAERVSKAAARVGEGTLPLFSEKGGGLARELPDFEGLSFWFDGSVIDELSTIKAMCLELTREVARDTALAAFSSIVVAVSRQDSDTRYVRREKKIAPGETLQRFGRALALAIAKKVELSEMIEARFTSTVRHANTLDEPDVGSVDLVVTSPPYPNAYSYHLYHRTRMLWLGMDQPTFKRVEIGSHRKYSSKGRDAADAATFRSELARLMTWLGRHLRKGGFACFVIGDSTIKGEVVRNDLMLQEVSIELGYKVEANISRRLQDAKKSFNPVIGRVKQEHIVILRKT